MTPIDTDTEVLHRMRRVETKITSLMLQLGFRRSDPPVWADGLVAVASPAVSLRDCLAVIPADTLTPVPIYCADDLLCWVSRGEES